MKKRFVFFLLVILLVSGFHNLGRATPNWVIHAEEYFEANDVAITDKAPLRVDLEFPYGITQVLAARLQNLTDGLTDATGLVAMRMFQIAHIANLPSLADLRLVESRYSDNLSSSDEIMERGFVHNQWNAPFSDFALGKFGTGRNNGCGPLAVYNALFYLRGGHLIYPNTYESERNVAKEIAENPASIIHFLEISGGVNAFGVAGTNPLVLTDYLRDAGYIAQVSYLPRNLDYQIRESNVSIFLYRGDRFYIHYVMIRFSGETERFYIYNWRGNVSHVRDSIDSWIAEYNEAGQQNYMPLALITISNII